MPIPLIAQAVSEGLSSIPYAYPFLKSVACLAVVALLKFYFGGARNRADRLMRSKVVMVTGGTSGVGAAIVYELALRGAQIILLTQHSPSDLFLVDYIQDLRRATKNQLIYAEQVDLTSLHSVRKFATKWVDNSMPRRLDMIILCANTLTPAWSPRRKTEDGLDEEWQVNYLANFHLLSILSPALRAQPPDRDVRIIFSTCSSYIGAELDYKQTEGVVEKQTKPAKQKTQAGSKSSGSNSSSKQTKKKNKSNMYGMSKLALMVFANAFQKHLSSHNRPDKHPVNAHVLVVDPGFSRTPGMRRWLTGGTLWGLLAYLLTWPLWWLILKSPQQGAQSFLYAAMDAQFARTDNTADRLIKECREVDFLRDEVRDEQVAKQLWEFSDQQIQTKEKEAAVRRAQAKKEKEQQQQQQQKTTTNNTSGSNSSSSTAAKSQTPGSRKSQKGK